eukprot:CAMPEP_0119378338 /NCGR_PEP_ID=MMETSP1334-20130426/47906_1 /TAXON_ID=127549 /ORGANISM="Calcidiscus leptoporus, Strain RCC1130" /LENGTH=84 /DNA_ID=CAMNT_0007397507 /DNA_START=8 /DNA_END=259 /DNA_ORIENTATION=-
MSITLLAAAATLAYALSHSPPTMAVAHMLSGPRQPPWSMSAAPARIDWSFLDAAYIITCPNDDGSNPRLERALQLLRAVGLEER